MFELLKECISLSKLFQSIMVDGKKRFSEFFVVALKISKFQSIDESLARV